MESNFFHPGFIMHATFPNEMANLLGNFLVLIKKISSKFFMENVAKVTKILYVIYMSKPFTVKISKGVSE